MPSPPILNGEENHYFIFPEIDECAALPHSAKFSLYVLVKKNIFIGVSFAELLNHFTILKPGLPRIDYYPFSRTFIRKKISYPLHHNFALF